MDQFWLDSNAVTFNFPLRFRFFLLARAASLLWHKLHCIYIYSRRMSDLFCSPTYLNSGKRHSIMSNEAMYYMRNLPNITIGMGMPCSTYQKASPMGALRIYKGRTLAGNVTNLAPPTPAHTYIFHSRWMHRLYQEARHPMRRRSGLTFWRQEEKKKDNRITISK